MSPDWAAAAPATRRDRDAAPMMPIDTIVRCSGWLLRRRDLLTRGYTDAVIRAALADHSIFRVWQGWYSVPDASGPAGWVPDTIDGYDSPEYRTCEFTGSIVRHPRDRSGESLSAMLFCRC